ncbi:MAG: 50S ribosomal protein L22 [Armatimonadota bacterium]
MQAKAVARYIRMSPRKARRVLKMVQGMPVKEAQGLLAVLPHAAARVVRRVIDSAAANAENNHGMDRDDLWIEMAYADEGPTLDRFRFASGGRIGSIKKRISHISVVLSDEER